MVLTPIAVFALLLKLANSRANQFRANQANQAKVGQAKVGPDADPAPAPTRAVDEDAAPTPD